MLATSDDGRVIGGRVLVRPRQRVAGVVRRRGVLPEGLPARRTACPDAFEGWINTGFVQSVTPDGRTLVGYGAGPTTFQGYMVVLPELDCSEAAAALLVLLLAAPAFAQRTEVALLGGYTTAGDIDDEGRRGSRTSRSRAASPGAGQAGHFFSDHLGLEVSWSRQDSDLVLGTAAGSAELFDMNAGRCCTAASSIGSAPEDARLSSRSCSPALGATFLSAERSGERDEVLVGRGRRHQVVPVEAGWGARVQARYAPTMLNDPRRSFCDPFGFCQGSLQSVRVGGWRGAPILSAGAWLPARTVTLQIVCVLRRRESRRRAPRLAQRARDRRVPGGVRLRSRRRFHRPREPRRGPARTESWPSRSSGHAARA